MHINHASYGFLRLKTWDFASMLGFRTPCELALNYLRAGSHHEPWSLTMEDGLFHGSDFMVQLPWSDLLKTNQFTKPLGPSLDVNRMWTKRNDHAPKSECAYLNFYFNMYQKGQFWEEKKKPQGWPFSCLRPLFLKKEKEKKKEEAFIQNLLQQHFFIMSSCLFLPNHFFCLSHHKNSLNHANG